MFYESPTSPTVHQERGCVLAGRSQAQQHMTSASIGCMVGEWFWQTSRVEPASNQPRRGFAPCGNHYGTPTNSRKQTSEKRFVPLQYAAAESPRYVLIVKISQKTLALYSQFCCILRKSVLRGLMHSRERHEHFIYLKNYLLKRNRNH